ncbi:hypothetical protein AMTRI_Chr04g246180 [Amborella trichopoda]
MSLVSQKSSVSHRIKSCMMGFSNFISDFVLLDILVARARFILSNNCITKPIMTRLDCFLVHAGWAELFHLASTSGLPKLSSIHVPLIWEGESRIWRKYYFKFEMAWLMERSVNDLIKETWCRNDVVGWSGYVASKKVKGVKKELIDWGKRNRCNYKVKVKQTVSKFTELDMKE